MKMDRTHTRPAIMEFFKYSHLPEGPMRRVSQECSLLAEQMHAALFNNKEKEAGLRKLLEAKDCFVRSAMVGKP